MKPTADFDELRQFAADLRRVQDLAYPKTLATQSLKSAARPLLRAEQANAPRRTGRLVADIRSKSVSNDKYYATVIVGVSKRKGKRGRITHLLTRGTGARFAKNGAYRGKVTANDFLDKSWQQTKGEVLALYEEDYNKRIAAWIKNIKYRSGPLKRPVK